MSEESELPDMGSSMGTDRLTRINELLRREIGESLFQLMNESNFDMAAVTVTNVRTSRNLRSAHVKISIREHHEDRNKMLGLIKSHRGEIQQRINTNLNMKFTPRLVFELDTSIEKGNHVLDLLKELEPESGGQAPDEAPEETP